MYLSSSSMFLWNSAHADGAIHHIDRETVRIILERNPKLKAVVTFLSLFMFMKFSSKV